MKEEKELIDRCLSHDPSAQEALYKRFASKMYGICLRFSGEPREAQDMLQEGFLKTFQKLKSYRFEGSFEGWIRRIFINTAINVKRRELKFNVDQDIDQNHHLAEDEADPLSRLSQQEWLNLIQRLPQGYRTVFNLYVIEGYKHREIGKMLKISENTSKSQLSGARKSLRKLLTSLGYDNGRER
ncbi:MAG: RNA polymerase sigma factor [Bacteroidia bacterium]|nr:RNA polymerase sigma factor [Bacteroidia bacterium]